MTDARSPLRDDTMIVTMTRGDIRELVRAEVAAGIASVVEPHLAKWVDVETAAAHCSVSGQTIRNWIDQGLPASHLGRDYRLRLGELDAWLERHRAIPRRLREP